MIIKRDKLFSPIIFDLEVNRNKEFIDLTKGSTEYLSTSEAYKLKEHLPFWDTCREYIQVYSKRYAFESYRVVYGGFVDSNCDIVALIVRDKEFNKYLIVREAFKSSKYYHNLIRTLNVFNVTDEYIITATKEELKSRFCTIISPSMEDYEEEVKRPIAQAFIQNLRKEYE